VAVLPRPPARDLRQPDRALNRRGGHRAHHRRRATAPSRGGRHRRARDLCHSDVEFKDGSIPGVIDFMPIVLGREAAGVISAVGDDVKDWKVSDRAAVHPNDAGLATADADPIGTRRNGAYAERRRRPGNTNSSLYPTTSIPIRPLPRRTRHDRLQLPRSTVAGRLAGLGPGRLAQLAPGETRRGAATAHGPASRTPSPPGSSPASDAWGTASPVLVTSRASCARPGVCSACATSAPGAMLAALASHPPPGATPRPSCYATCPVKTGPLHVPPHMQAQRRMMRRTASWSFGHTRNPMRVERSLGEA
jgi:hypothetical protein